MYLGGPLAKAAFRHLMAMKDTLENSFGNAFEWEELAQGQDSRIAVYMPGQQKRENRQNWPAQQSWIGRSSQTHLDTLTEQYSCTTGPWRQTATKHYSAAISTRGIPRKEIAPMVAAIARPSNGGTAFPTCTYWSVREPLNSNLSGNDCNRAASRTVSVRFCSGWKYAPQ